MAKAEPLLGSALLGDDELDVLVEGLCAGKRMDGEWRLGTGVKSLDGSLAGSVTGGNVVGIWSDGTGGNEVCRALLVNSLLQYPGSMAAVIDTTGNFDVLRLYTLILARLQKERDVLVSARNVSGSGSNETVEDVAAMVLDHVKIMRVFDFVGIKEAIDEIRNDLEDRKMAKKKREEVRNAPVLDARPSTLEPLPIPKRTVVADSEDEDEDEEMLFDGSTPTIESIPVVKDHHQADSSEVAAKQAEVLADADQAHSEEKTPGKVRFILINNLAQVINPLLKKDYIQANTLASAFLHGLSHLTRAYKLHTILANPTTQPRATSAARPTPINPNQTAPPPEQRKQQPPLAPSIFASSTLLPSLASILPRYVDTSLLVSQIPRRKIDARVFYRDGSGASLKKLRGVEMVNVMEVVSDRWESRVGAWGAFMEGETGMQSIP